MKIDTLTLFRPDREHSLSAGIVEMAEQAEAMGVDGVFTPMVDNDAFLPLPLIAEHTEEVDIGTRIALSFTQSPMVLAYKAWDLAQYSDGRFSLGLGTQVKSHNERRFSVEWTAPNQRLREVVESVQHIWDVWQGEADELDYQGEHYSFDLMSDLFDPGPIDNPDIPIHLAATNERNLRLTGELADGLAMHSFNTPRYVEEVIRPTVSEGAERTDRSLDDVEIVAIPFTITGTSEEELAAQRERVKTEIAFYGGHTRTYHDVLELHGWEDVGERLHELADDHTWAEMTHLVTDEMVDAFAIEAHIDDLAEEIDRSYGDLADRIQLQHVFTGDETWEGLVEDLHSL